MALDRALPPWMFDRSSRLPLQHGVGVTTPEIPQEIRSLLSDEALAQIAQHRIRIGGTTDRDAVELAVAWNGNVRKIDADRALSSSDRGVRR